LPLAEILLGFGQFHDVAGGILKGDELAAAGQRDRIGEETLPARRCHQANSSAPQRCRSGVRPDATRDRNRNAIPTNPHHGDCRCAAHALA
jgi:hypothetical protein